MATPGLNVTNYRAPGSVWDRPGWNGAAERTPLVRWLIALAAGAAAARAIQRRPAGWPVVAGLGGTVACFALVGRIDAARVRLWLQDAIDRAHRTSDPVHEASADSFPASD